MISVKSYKLPTIKLYDSNKTLYDRSVITITAQAGNPISCYCGVDDDIFLTIEHNDKYNEDIEYQLLFVSGELKVSSLSDYKFLNTIVNVGTTGGRSYIKDIYHVYAKTFRTTYGMT